MRYAPLGVMVDKRWLYERGGRPVIYQSHAEFDELPESKQHLHVRYEPDQGIDYSWEREWRIKTDSLELDPEQTTIVVPSRLRGYAAPLIRSSAGSTRERPLKLSWRLSW
jgi:hypothetical protein